MSVPSPRAAGGPSPPDHPSGSSMRRDRASIAAQACETCRVRKSKCDERRPKCGLCQRVGAECRYRDPLPTKKDKTMVFMLDAIQRIEAKVDHIGRTVDPESGAYEAGPYTTPPSGRLPSISSVSMLVQDQPLRDQDNPPLRQSQAQSPLDMTRSVGNRSPDAHISSSHKVLLWPFIHARLAEFDVDVAEDLHVLTQEGTPWFLHHELHRHPDPLPCDARLEAEPAPSILATNAANRVRFPKLTYEEMKTYTAQYFNTFNMLYLILDRQHFTDVTLPRVANHGFGDGDYDSIISLLVFALGQVALDGTWSAPVDNGMPFESGVRGGTHDRPPGLDIFNEARRRYGFVAHQSSIESIQITLLFAVYYESCGRHLDFWRASRTAASSFQIVIRSTTIDWFTHQGNLVKKLYWTCNSIEHWFHYDLDLPHTGVCDHEDEVPLPGEIGGYRTEEEQQTVMYFLAMIALRQLVTRVHKTIFEASRATSEIPEGYDGPPTHVIRELSRQLESWRSTLPPPLQWADQPPESRFQYFPPGSPKIGRCFTPNGNQTPLESPDTLDLVVAHLRSRYYYARFILYRPFVYKVLHWPGLTTNEDRQFAGLCIQSTLLWPIALAPPKRRKRLVPFLFVWTQNFISILLVLRATTVSNILADVCRKMVDNTELMLTVQCLLEWLADVRTIDGVALWSWKILDPLFRDIFPHVFAVGL
ncbi:c6 finger domain protein [Diplodia corticola]|uniref:C6 finger domain protein n=1 Tax=Diplodia corticola TaxID=236234 RepID=A0A1J9QUC7_9PEZI|nr:c6 finger domain protein [Diplodia corticola]OJD32009.1 c6 finger domain protein [Diplodia corticola]